PQRSDVVNGSGFKMRAGTFERRYHQFVIAPGSSYTVPENLFRVSRPIRKIGGNCKCRRNAGHPRGSRSTSSKSSVKRAQIEYLCALGSPSTTSWACLGKMKGAAGCW
ncbi:unnamed protein product, partial [Pylaiella littoralis]